MSASIQYGYSDFHDSPEERLNRLKSLLDHKYDPSSIWKELLQNAEDAGATQLHFAVLTPDARGGHPFETVPLLCALNDGAFSQANSQAIARMGLGTKGADEDSIGKFGLGMKSVFNLGEVLFYFASPSQNAAREAFPDDEAACFGKLLNPYAKIGVNTHWKLDDGRTRNPLTERLLKRLREQEWCKACEANGQKRWFALLLPLRHENYVSSDSALVQTYPVASNLFPDDLSERLAALFPMLRNLERVSVWRESDLKTPWFSIGVQNGARRARKISELRPLESSIQPIGGILVSDKNPRRFEGHENLLPLENFAETGIERGAQNLFTQGEDGEGATLRREKYAPHGAAVWGQNVSASKLCLRPAVWLPLPEQNDFQSGQSDAQTLHIPGCDGLQLTLHGNFFIDDGRRNMVLGGTDRNGELPHSLWNKQILRDATLPLVLPALRDFLASFNAERPSTVQIREITRALTEQANWFVEEPEKALTRNGNWLYQLSGPPTPDLTVSVLKRKALERTAEVGKWVLISTDEYWVLPAPPEGSEADALENPAASIFEWLPALKTETSRRLIIWDWPCLTRQSAQNWDEAQILALFKDAKGEKWFASRVSIRYMLRLLDHWGTPQLTEAMWERVVELANEGLKAFTFGTRLQEKSLIDAWRDFWRLVPRRFWLPFEIGTKAEREKEAPALVARFQANLLDLHLKRCPVPIELAPSISPDKEVGDDGLWPATDAKKVAQWFAWLFASPQADTTKLAGLARVGRLVEKISERGEPKYEIIGSYALFKTKEWRDSEKPKTGILRSWHELEKFNRDKRLWADTNLIRGKTGASSSDWLAAWCRAVQVEEPTPNGEQSWVVSVESSDQASVNDLWPDEDSQPKPFDARACLLLLQKKPPLRDIAGRAVLAPRLFEVLKSEPSTANKRAIRYLLHGEARVFEDDATLIRRGDDEIWHSLMQTAWPKEFLWQIIPNDLSKEISNDIADRLNVRSSNRENALRTLRERRDAFAALSFDFSSDARAQVLRDLTENLEDRDLWRALPLHEVTGEKGIRVGALPNEGVYLEGRHIAVPDELQSTQTLVKSPHLNGLREVYQKFGVREFSHESLLELALLQDRPERFCTTILKTLEHIGINALQSDLLQDLREIAWLPLGSAVYAPSQVVNLPLIESSTARLLRAVPDVGATAGQMRENYGKQAGWHILASLWANRNEAGNLIRLALERPNDISDEWALGTLGFKLQIEARLPDFMDAWNEVGGAKPRGVELLQILWKEEGMRPLARQIAPAMLRQVAVSTLESWLQSVSNALQHQMGADRETRPLVALHYWLLESLASHPQARRQGWENWLFPNRNGEWKSPQVLARRASGIEPTALLHPDWAALLENHPALITETGVRPRPERASDRWQILQEELGLWNASEGLKDALVTVLGAKKDEARDATKLCSEADQKRIWTELGGVQKFKDYYWALAETHPFYFSWNKSSNGQTYASNLLGQQVAFSLQSEGFDSLLVGNISPNSGDGWHIQLRRLEGQNMIEKRTEMTSVLQNTIVDLVRAREQFENKKVYLPSDDQHQTRFHHEDVEQTDVLIGRLTECFARWNESEQIDLEVAQNWMLENAFFYFRSLSGKMKPKLRELHQRDDALRYEFHRPISVRKDAKELTGEEKRAQLLIELRNNLNTEAFCEETRDLVRRKIRDLGYEQTAIPFELFQNADDAAHELTEAGAQGENTPLLHIELRENLVRWRHCGRRINFVGRLGRLDPQQVRDRGYGRDLEKMLILQASDKASDQKTTGKFGLGFKTVFLVSRRPRVQSGELCFEVVGGFYPQATEKEELRREETQIQFALDDSKKTESDIRTTVFGRFWRLLPLQLCFARTLRECRWSVDGQTLHCAPLIHEIAPCIERVSYGVLPNLLGAKQNESLPSGLLRLQVEGLGQLLVGLNENGAVAFPADVPVLWATTPMRATLGHCFALNADWSVDVGRTQLADDKDNEILARDLASGFVTIMRQLVEAAQKDWPALAEKLGVSTGSYEEFLRGLASIFTTVTGHDRRIDEITRAVLQPLEPWSAVTPTSPQPLRDWEEIEAWWQEERPKVFKRLEGPFYPDHVQVYEYLKSKNETEKRRAWLTLLLRASLESVGRIGDPQKRGFISFCAKRGGWIDRFSALDADISSLGRELQTFLDKDHSNHQYLHLLRHSLPVFALGQWLDAYIQILLQLEKRRSLSNMSFLKPRTDSNWDLLLDVPDAPELGKVLGIGEHFLLRELVRAGILDDERAHPLCFHPTESLCRVLAPLDARFDTQKNRSELSKMAHDLTQGRHFGLYFDIPLVHWAEREAKLS